MKKFANVLNHAVYFYKVTHLYRLLEMDYRLRKIMHIGGIYTRGAVRMYYNSLFYCNCNNITKYSLKMIQTIVVLLLLTSAMARPEENLGGWYSFSYYVKNVKETSV